MNAEWSTRDTQAPQPDPAKETVLRKRPRMDYGGLIDDWYETYGTQPVRTRNLVNLPSCPLDTRKGQKSRSKNLLGQILGMLADTKQPVVVNDPPMVRPGLIERHFPEGAPEYPRWWRLSLS